MLKFPLILQKMLRSIDDSSKNNDPLNKKSVENGINKEKDVMNKTPLEDHNKKDTSDKTVGNLDKIISSTTGKNQQISTPTPRKNVPPFLLNLEIFNINVHNFMVDSGASSNVMHFSIC